jgi:16S rRNA (uracil1498-N3)-methyltransferase
MSSPYFFLENNIIENNSIVITGDDFFHLVKVLRAKTGQEVYISDNAGLKYKTEITYIKKDRTILSIKDKTRVKKPAPKVVLFLCILKKEAMETAIQKTVEIGIDSITPVISRRTVFDFKDEKTKQKKLLRWQQIAIEAAKQCKRDFMANINPPENIESISAVNNGVLYAAFEETGNFGEPHSAFIAERDLLEKNILKKSCQISYLIGPEGGFEDYEKEIIIKNGAVPFNFGKNILRSETAAIYFLTIIDYFIKSSKII